MTIETIDSTSEFYPKGLHDLGANKPEQLFVRGNLDALKGLKQSVAMVGARASTGYGEHITMELTTALVERGATIVNGGAYGIDGMAIRTALAANSTPIVWLAGGVDRFYPSGHDTLFARVLDIGGAIISAEETGSAPTKWRFQQRNKFLGYSASATVVSEAGWRSGSLLVAQSAFEAGNFVGAMPGPITSASSAGCHRIIRDGVATLVTSASEIEYRLR